MRLLPMSRRPVAALVAGVMLTASWAAGEEDTRLAAQELHGELDDGTPYLIVVPENWNGTVLVDLDFASGGSTKPVWTDYLLPRGYAGAGTTRDKVAGGWDVRAAVDNQVETLDRFRERVGEPERTIAFGRSGGGNTAASLAQRHPEVLDGVVAACAILTGAVPAWNGKLDTLFALKALLDPDGDLPIVNLPADPAPGTQAWQDFARGAQSTREGRARLALAATLGQLPIWGVGSMPEPARGDVEAQQYAIYRGLVEEFFPTAMASGYRQELLGGGVPRWNNGIDYRQIFGIVNAAQRDLVRELYLAAGLDLDEDLATIDAHPRIVADPSAVAARQQDNSYTGDLRVPMLTLDNTGDVISPVSAARSYSSTVRSSGNQEMLRQAFVHSAGHCGFSAGEQAAAVETLMHRLDTGAWGDAATPQRLNALAATLLPDDEPARFIGFHPDRFARPFDADDVYDPNEV